MGIRERLNSNKIVSSSVSVLVVLGSIAFLVWWFRTPEYPIPTKAYYTDDGGKTYFVDDLWKVVPFKHNGKNAYRAYVFSYDKGSKDYIGYVTKFDDDTAKTLTQQVDEAVKAGQPVSSINEFGAPETYLYHTLVGTPDGSEWGGENSDLAIRLKSQPAPDGSHPEVKVPEE